MFVNELDAALVVDDLSVSYGDVHAVRGVSFAARRGTITALVGANGAGKSTTLAAVTTSLNTYRGSVRVCGLDARTQRAQVRSKLGVVFQEQTLDPELTCRRNLTLHGRVHRMPKDARRTRVAALTDHFGLSRHLDTRVDQLSGGTARRVELVRALLPGPDMLVLDEPTAGLDPESRSLLWDDLHHLTAEFGTTVLVSTHYLGEIEDVQQIVMLGDGEVIRSGTPAALMALVDDRTGVEIAIEDPDEAERLLGAAGFDTARRAAGLFIRTADPGRDVLAMHALLGSALSGFDVRRPSLDDLFGDTP